MFDDLLSALALIGVTGTLVAAATSLATGPADPVSAAVPPGPDLALRAAAPAAPSSATGCATATCWPTAATAPAAPAVRVEATRARGMDGPCPPDRGRVPHRTSRPPRM